VTLPDPAVIRTILEDIRMDRFDVAADGTPMQTMRQPALAFMI
jgi:hypothetical protein